MKLGKSHIGLMRSEVWKRSRHSYLGNVLFPTILDVLIPCPTSHKHKTGPTDGIAGHSLLKSFVAAWLY